MANLVKFYRGIFNNWVKEDHVNGIYFATDTGQIIFTDLAGNKIVSGVNNSFSGNLNTAFVAASWVTPDTIRFTEANGSTTDVKLSMASGSVAGLMSKEHFSKVEGIESGAEVNVIEKIQLDGAEVSVSDKTANILVNDKINAAKEAAITAGAVSIAVEDGTGNVYKKYTFTQNNKVIGTIDTIKDLVVKSGSIVESVEGKILRLVLNDENEDVIDIPVSSLVDVYTAGSYITIGENNEISVNFGTLDNALAAESAIVGAAIKAAKDQADKGVSDAAAAKSAADAVAGLVGKADASASTETAFGRIKSLEDSLDILTGGEGGQSVSGQIESAINTLKGDNFTSGTLTALESLVNTNTGKISTLTGEGEGSVKKALADAKAYTDDREVVINGKISAANQAIADEASRADTEEKRLAGLIDTNTQNLNKVDGKIEEAVQAEEDRAVAAENAINAKIGTVPEGSNLVSMIEAAGAKATTKIAEGTDEGNNMSITESTAVDGSKTYTINLSDVASASKLATEIENRTNADTANANAIADVKTTADTNKGNLNTLMGEATVTGSIKQQIATAKTESYADAKAYADSLASNYDAAGSAAAVDAKLATEVARAKAAEEANATAAANAKSAADTAQGTADANARAINVLNGDASTSGSVANSIAGVIGTTSDAVTADTLHGVRNYADSLLTWHEA